MSRSRFMAALVIPTLLGLFSVAPAQEFRTIDGSGNHLTNPAMGSAGTPLVREIASDYADGVSDPAGPSRPSARLVSNLICTQTGSIPNSQGASDFLWQWGQFIDHDIDLTPTDNGNPLAALPIAVPAGDPFFDPTGTGTATIGFTRSIFEAASNPREQQNAITAWIDASNVYGSDTARAQALRTLDGTGRMLTTTGDLLPFNVAGFPNAQPPGFDPGLFFLAGDVRANEQVGLTAMHTLFVREHNRLATEIALASPGIPGDEIYLRARRIVGAQLQRITYEEFIPALLGPGALAAYTGYDPTVEAGIRNIFSAACYRFGHSMLSPTLRRFGEGGMTIAEGDLPLAAAFFSPEALILDGGIEPVLRGLAAQESQEIDPQVIDSVRNFLFGPPGAGGFDLASLNIQRGRDHGLPGYNATRVALGLTPMTSFAAVTNSPERQQDLADTYLNVDEIDLWIGALCEDHAPGAMVGELLLTVLAEQFAALRDGDRFWYQIDLTGAELADVESTSLAMIILRNTSVEMLPDDVFHLADPEFVRGDCTADGQFDIADAVHSFEFLFATGLGMQCAEACDSNDDDSHNLADGIYTLSALFQGGPFPPPPHPSCAPGGLGPNDMPCFRFDVCP